MARRTKKVGITGKFGPRYGVTVRKKIKEASKPRQAPQKCPECQYMAVKRESSGIWLCRHCGLKFAASAYSIKTREFKKEQAKVLEYEALTEEQVSNLQEKESKRPAQRRPRFTQDTVEEIAPEEDEEIVPGEMEADEGAEEIEPDTEADIEPEMELEAEEVE